MTDFVNDPAPTFRTFDWKAICDKANERVPDPPVYVFGEDHEFFDPQDPYRNFPEPE